ncbi:serine/threonine-protein kinase Nek4-like isoform X2 [Ostrea edulis]|uniref:serine/threonine-protein kinase Nek4-like isoform X2 n=1 Tax=Ostrea edulis TaxID=37623 RepID=UPI002095E22C|nr:serine/threonine-protein kinase Nek4-like isoform X2 [Ostrea edulis]
MPSVGRYEILEEIGRGTYGVVHQAQLKYGNGNQKDFAVKEINFKKANSKELEHLAREEDILKSLCEQRHENIVQYIESFKINTILYLVMEYCAGGSLYQYLRERNTGLDENEFKTYLEQILNGVQYLHSKDILHRDLKTKNILLTSDGRIKIADFGVAKRVQTCSKAANTVMVGTLYYAAPEMMDSKGIYSKKVDIWAIGCDCYEMGTSKYAFESKNIEELKEAVKRNKLPNINSLRFCEKMQEMIITMLATNPANRPEAKTLHNEVSRHHCQNTDQTIKTNKQTQVFSHSTSKPGQPTEKVFLSSQRSNISTIHGREPMQNTDSFDAKDKGDFISIEGSLLPPDQENDHILQKSGEQCTDSFTSGRKMSSSSFQDSQDDDIVTLYKKSTDKFDKMLYNTLCSKGGRDVHRKLGMLLMEETSSVGFEQKVDKLLGERFNTLRPLVLTLKNLEDGLKEYSRNK